MNRTSKILRYVSWRLLQAIPIILAIVVLNFFLLNLAEGDAVDVLAGEAGSATPEYMAQLRAKFGLDQPLPIQLHINLHRRPSTGNPTNTIQANCNPELPKLLEPRSV